MRHWTGISLAILFVLFSSSQLSAQSDFSSPGVCSSSSPALVAINQIPLIGVALIALSISLDVIAIGYIVGKLVPGTQLTPWVKKEYLEVAKSAILIAGVYAILLLLGGLGTSLVGVSQAPGAQSSLSSPFSLLSGSAQAYLQTLMGCARVDSQTVTSVSWNWGDNVQSQGTCSIVSEGLQSCSASHTYAASGPYTINVIVQSANGAAISTSANVVADSSTSPVSFSSGSSTGLGVGVSFSGTKTGNAASTQATISQGAGGTDYLGYMIGLSLGLGFLRSLTVSYYIPIPTPGVSFTLGTSFVPYKNSLLLNSISDAKTNENLLNDVITVIVLPTYTIIDITYYLLPLFVYSGLAFLIPLGIIFRAMPFLRGIGGTLFGIGVGVSIVLPSMLLLVNAPIGNMLAPYLGISQSAASAQTFFGINPSTLPAIPWTNGGFDAFSSFGTIYPALNGIISFSIFSVIQFMLFVVDLAIAFPIVEAIAKSLGGTISVEFGRFKIR